MALFRNGQVILYIMEQRDGIPTDSFAATSVFVSYILKWTDVKIDPDESSRGYVRIEGKVFLIEDAFEELCKCEHEHMMDFVEFVQNEINHPSTEVPEFFATCEKLAEELHMKEQFKEEEQASGEDVQFIATALWIRLILGKQSWTYTTLSSFTNLIGYLDRFCDRLKIKPAKDFSLMYDKIDQILLNDRVLNEPSQLAVLYRYTATENNPLGLESGEYVIKVLSNTVDARESTNLNRSNGYETESNILNRLTYENVTKMVGYAEVVPESNYKGNKEATWIRPYMKATKRCLIFVFYQGGTLHHNLEGFNWHEALRFAERLAYTIHLCHSAHVLHLDIKPRNICLNENREPILIDFGNSKLENQEMSTKMNPYIEVTSVADWMVDIYSFGLVLLTIIDGEPMEGAVQERIRQLLAADEPARLLRPWIQEGCNNNCAKQVLRLVQECITENRETRPPAYQIVNMLKKLQGLLTSQS